MFHVQVSFRVDDVGKRRPRNKKCVTWVFGSTPTFNSSSDQQQQQHTVVLEWSKRSGKQSITVNGAQEWFGRRKKASILSHQWEQHGVHFHILATRVTPKIMKNKGFCKYDLLLNGQLFSKLLLPHQDGKCSHPSQEGAGPSSIVQVLYPNGYNKDEFTGEPLSPAKHNVTSTVDDYQHDEQLRQRVTARRIVRRDGTAR
jgi:hypothetical protein